MDETTKYGIVKRALDGADPYGLLKMGAPDDEYDIESSRIAAAVFCGDSEDEIAQTAADIFSEAFSRKFTAAMFRSFASEVRRELELLHTEPVAK